MRVFEGAIINYVGRGSSAFSVEGGFEFGWGLSCVVTLLLTGVRYNLQPVVSPYSQLWFLGTFRTNYVFHDSEYFNAAAEPSDFDWPCDGAIKIVCAMKTPTAEI